MPLSQLVRRLVCLDLLSTCPPLTTTITSRQMSRVSENRSRRPIYWALNKRRENVELNQMLKQGKVPVDRRANFAEWNYQAELQAFSSRLGEKFDPTLLSQAFVTESHVAAELEQQRELGVQEASGVKDNQALAEKGADIIDVTLTRWLRAALPRLPLEGVEAVKNYLSSEEMLAEVSFHLGTRELLLTPEYPPSRANLARVLQALLGALDRTRAEQLVVDVVASQLAGKDVTSIWEVEDPMAVLAGVLARSDRGPPESRLLWQSGPGSVLASYTVGVYSDRELVGESHGESLAIAEEMAARDGLRRQFCIEEGAPPLPWGRLEDLQQTN